MTFRWSTASSGLFETIFENVAEGNNHWIQLSEDIVNEITKSWYYRNKKKTKSKDIANEITNSKDYVNDIKKSKCYRN